MVEYKSKWADEAGVQDPDSNQSAGAKWLRNVIMDADELVDEIKEGNVDYPEDRISEVADGAVPIYNHEVWAVWVDLGMWSFEGELHDSSTYGPDHMTKMAQIDLYEAAQNLISYVMRKSGVL